VVAVAGVSVVLAACSSAGPEGQASTTVATVPAEVTVAPAPTTDPPATTDPPTTSSTTTTVPPSTAPASTAPPSTAPPPAAPVPGQPNPACIYQVKPGDSLSAIAAALNNVAIGVDELAAENGITNVNAINAGTSLDVCPGNGVDDITGGPRVPPTTEPAPPPPPAPTTPNTVAAGTPLPTGARAQQDKLNALFANLGLPPLTVDGQSGRLTKQQLCAARVALNVPVSRDNMAPGSPEEQALMSLTALPTPPAAPIQAGRWALIDQTCQIMFVGDGPNHVQFVFQTSTGMGDHPTRNQTASRVFRYDPAADNNGWHDSTEFPAAGDNPLNGNMYKPLYFAGGEAIHGANTVPTSPASHGCARLHLESQNALVDWLGIGGETSQVWSKSKIGLTVTVQGAY
jgi:LysM domain/L,D-transpeptidase catalytic domain